MQSAERIAPNRPPISVYNLTTNGATFTVSNLADTLTVGGAIGGSGTPLIKGGAGTLVLNGASDYTNGEPTGLAKEFLDFTISGAGQKIAGQVGFVPIP